MLAAAIPAIFYYGALFAFTSIYTPNFKLHLIGDTGVDNEFIVRRIRITCAGLADLTCTDVPMLESFDMTSNITTYFAQSSLLPDCLNFRPLSCSRFQHVAASTLGSIQVYSPVLGWFKKEPYQSDPKYKCFTYNCKFRCNARWNFMNDMSYDLLLQYGIAYVLNNSCLDIFANHEELTKIDEYIYALYTFFLLYDGFQVKQSRGRLYFQEREDDEDMALHDTPTLATEQQTPTVTDK